MRTRLFSFNEFEQTVYESNNYINDEAFSFLTEEEEKAVTPPATPEEETVIDPATGKPKSIKSILSLFTKIDKENKEQVAESEEEIQEAEVNTLKIVKLGEQSDRVKKIQEALKINQSGIFDKATLVAVKTFQKENGLKVDGKVGPQTYGKMLEITLGDKAEAEKALEEFKKMGTKGSQEVNVIITDPRFYELFEKVTTINIEGKIYVILVPKKDALEKAQKMKADGFIKSGFEWLLKAAEFVGKAVIYTAAGVVSVALGVASAMISGAMSIIGAAAKGTISVVGDILSGLAQIAEFAYKKTAEAMSAVVAGAQNYWKGFVQTCSKAWVKTKENAAKACMAFLGAVGSVVKAAGTALLFVGQVALGVAVLATEAVVAGIKAAIGGAKSAAEAAVAGVKWLAKKGAEAAKEVADLAKRGYQAAVDATKAAGAAVVAGLAWAGDAVTNAIGAGMKAAGAAMTAAGQWLEDLFEGEEFAY